MVQAPDGKYYLYYFTVGTKMISVVVCDEPAGKYEFYGYVKYGDDVPVGKKNEPFQFDSGIFMDDDGRLYMYSGFALAENSILLGGSKPTEHGLKCFEQYKNLYMSQENYDIMNCADAQAGHQLKLLEI